MNITVVHRVVEKRELICAVASYLAQVLKIDNSRYNLIIYTVPGMAKNSGMNGAISKTGDRELLMALDSRLSLEQMCTTIAHEMVHAKQHAKGQLKLYTKRNGEVGFKWLGRKYYTDYFDWPWEIEAFSRERILTNKIIKLIKNG
jgi:hypothetical protein